MLLPTARDCADNVSASSTMASYYILALSNIATALGTGARTCTLTTAGKAGDDVQAVRQALVNNGFIVTQSSTTITISWGAN